MSERREHQGGSEGVQKEKEWAVGRGDIVKRRDMGNKGYGREEGQKRGDHEGGKNGV